MKNTKSSRNESAAFYSMKIAQNHARMHISNESCEKHGYVFSKKPPCIMRPVAVIASVSLYWSA